MGMFDYVKYEMDCPKCGAKVKEFQSKDGMCVLAEIEYWEVDYFYGTCPSCKVWIEFIREIPPIIPVPITDFKMIVGEERS